VTATVVIVGCLLGAFASATVLAIALGITAARADKQMELQAIEHRLDRGYAGFAFAQETISREPSITVSSSSSSVGTVRFPVSRSTP
jgi:hypothetical protein